MRKLFSAALALTMGVATAPAFAQSYDEVVAANKAANEAAVARTKEEAPMAKTLYTLASWSTENSNPTFACYDPADKATCQTVRGAAVEGGTVWFVTFANKTTGGCFQPDSVDYRMCSDNAHVWGRSRSTNSSPLRRSTTPAARGLATTPARTTSPARRLCRSRAEYERRTSVRLSRYIIHQLHGRCLMRFRQGATGIFPIFTFRQPFDLAKSAAEIFNFPAVKFAKVRAWINHLPLPVPTP